MNPIYYYIQQPYKRLNYLAICASLAFTCKSTMFFFVFIFGVRDPLTYSSVAFITLKDILVRRLAIMMLYF